MTAAILIALGILFCLGMFYLARRIIRKADEEKD
jgi:hypothetical protein